MSNASSAALDTTASALAAFLEVEQSVLDAVPTGLCVCGPDGRLRRYNAPAVALWELVGEQQRQAAMTLLAALIAQSLVSEAVGDDRASLGGAGAAGGRDD